MGCLAFLPRGHPSLQLHGRKYALSRDNICSTRPHFWSATQSSYTTRRAIRDLSMKCGESCSARGTKRWNKLHQLKIPCRSTQNELPTSLEYGRHVNWPISRHPVQKDVDGHWMETARYGVLFGALCRWLRKPALNWSSAVVKAQVAVVKCARVRRHTGNAQSFAVVNVTHNFINILGNSKAAVCILFFNQGP